jgi:tyrosyl-tRNA synthetase
VNPDRKDLVAALRERGLVYQVTAESLGPLSLREPIGAYIGFDPTAASLHAGSLYPVMILCHLARAGHRPVALVGGGTGLIGDPSGRESERPLLDEAAVRAQVDSQRAQLARLLAAGGVEAPEVADNAEWLRGLGLVEFLRDTGKHFTVNSMMARDSVRTRLEDRAQGISFTEFSYMLLQAYDFWRLYATRGVRLQLGGSDQWGNIVGGVELIRRREGAEAFGVTCPLLLAADGRKFGKSAGNAVWLDGAMTPPSDFYQFFINQDDATAATLLGAYTFLPMDEVRALREESKAAPEKRIAQRRVAFEVTRFVHGEAAAREAEAQAARVFRRDGIEGLDADALLARYGGVPTFRFPGDFDAAAGPLTALAAFVRTGLCKSGSDFRRKLAEGALHLNEVRLPASAVDGGDALLPSSKAVSGRVLLLRKGKKEFALVVLE